MDYSEKHLHSSIKMWWLLPWDIHSSLQTKKYFFWTKPFSLVRWFTTIRNPKNTWCHYRGS